MIIYFIKATLCAFFFLFIYMVLFERENMHRFKRHYLLCSLVLSFVIPLVALDIAIPLLNKEISNLYTESKTIERIPEQIAFLINRLYTESNMTDLISEPAIVLTETPSENNISTLRHSDYSFIAKVLYVIVMFALLLRLSGNMFRLLYRAKKGQRIVNNDKNLVLIKENLVPFSFGRYIYINKDDYKNGLIAEDMILHRSEERRVGKKCRSRWSPYH